MAYYNIYTPSNCDAQIPDHLCSDCGVVENARVRSVAFIKKNFVFTNPSNPQEWLNGITSKQIIIIPATNGTFDGGAEQESDGYGDQVTKLNGYIFTLNYKDPNYSEHNGQFYNELKRSRNYYVAWRTSTQIHFSDKVVEIIPKNPVTAPTTDEVTYDVTVKWTNDDIPVPYNTPDGIFNCFEYLS
jgi:hypothetical protein